MKDLTKYTLAELEDIEHQVIGVAKMELDIYLHNSTEEQIIERSADPSAIRDELTKKKSVSASFNMAKAIMDYVADKRARGRFSDRASPESEIAAAIREVDAAKKRMAEANHIRRIK